MAAVNKAILVGNLGRDPDVKHLGADTTVANFSIATNEKRGDEEKTQWHRIVAFGKLADICGQYLHKGDSVYIEGRIQYREWEKDGVKRTSTDIIAHQMVMLGGKRDAGSSAGSLPQDVECEDIPF